MSDNLRQGSIGRMSKWVYISTFYNSLSRASLHFIIYDTRIQYYTYYYMTHIKLADDSKVSTVA